MKVLCEPQCIGFEHAVINSAFVACMSKAYDSEEILFIAEKTHIQCVKSLLDQNKVNYDNIKFKQLKIANPGIIRHFLPNLSKLAGEHKTIKTLLKIAFELKLDKLILLSVNALELKIIKKSILKRPKLKVKIVLHGVLHEILYNKKNPFKNIFSFKKAFDSKTPENLQYITLAPYIKDELLNIYPKYTDIVSNINMPYFFSTDKTYTPFKDNSLHLGYLGIIGKLKNPGLFVKIAKYFYENHKSKTKFSIIGTVYDKKMRNEINDYINFPPYSKPIERTEYEKKIGTLDFAILLHNKEMYRLAISGSLYDAISGLKPVIALKNVSLEYFSKTFGDIGYLCDTYDEILETIEKIIRQKDIKRYNLMRQNLKKAKEALSYEKQIDALINIWKK